MRIHLVSCTDRSIGMVIVAMLLIMFFFYPSMGQTLLVDTETVAIPEGGTERLGVKLSAQPLSTTRLKVSWLSGDSDIAVQDNAILTFDRINWNVYQYVTLAAAKDSDSDRGTAIIRIHRIAGDAIPYKDITAIEEDKLGSCISLPRGWNLVSIPVDPETPSPEIVFEGISPLYLYKYNGSDYDSVTSGKLARVEALTGYWLYLDEARSVCVDGEDLSGNQVLRLGRAGWHLIGVPYSVMWGSDTGGGSGPPPPPGYGLSYECSREAGDRTQASNGSVTITKQTQTLTIYEAAAAGWIYGTVWGYNTLNDRYEPISISSATTLTPWKGYWLLTYDDNVTLNFSGTGTGSSLEPPPPPPYGLMQQSDLLISPPLPPDLAVNSPFSDLHFASSSNLITDVNTVEFTVKGAMSTPVEAFRVEIFDYSGLKVWHKETLGTSILWHSENWYGQYLPNGVYFCRMYALVTGQWIYSECRALVVVR